jgi:ABC-type phosphate/phosphonate transport system substrate-binding protein
MRPLVRFAIAAERHVAEAAFHELSMSLAAVCSEQIEPVFVADYPALRRAVETDRTLLAWAPPLVALDLMRSAVATPLLAVGRRGRTSYFSALVGTAGKIAHVGQLRGVRMGWVSPLSAAGYAVPRLYLRALGLDPAGLFGSETFLGTHERAVRALVDGEVDAIATYAKRESTGLALVIDPRIEGAPVLATIGPIPGDVVLAGSGVPASTRAALRGGFLAVQPRADGPLARLMNVDRFEIAPLGHFDALRRWSGRAEERPAPAAETGDV